MSYAQEVGERLRRVRADRGLSLQDVERLSEGRWKAAVIGSYERGDRNISASRLLELAEFYEVPASDVLPGGGPVRRGGDGGAVVIDLRRLEDAGEPWSGVRRYCESIQLQRGDYNRQVLSIRGEDLRALAVIINASTEELLERLREEELVADG